MPEFTAVHDMKCMEWMEQCKAGHEPPCIAEQAMLLLSLESQVQRKGVAQHGLDVAEALPKIKNQQEAVRRAQTQGSKA